MVKPRDTNNFSELVALTFADFDKLLAVSQYTLGSVFLRIVNPELSRDSRRTFSINISMEKKKYIYISAIWRRSFYRIVELERERERGRNDGGGGGRRLGKGDVKRRRFVVNLR